MIKEFSLKTTQREAFIDITGEVEDVIKASGARSGICTIFVPHTTAAVTINENADPGVISDIIKAMKKMVPETLSYAHAEGNSPAHVKATLVGASETVFIKDGSLHLGRWQGIYFCEFDGPRSRRVSVNVIIE
ncbi:MAG: secondary thiamine-phosphate synthase enzyme YjbQ [Candidatus Omnitrophota bacterium]